jgi:hypothetical protein
MDFCFEEPKYGYSGEKQRAKGREQRAERNLIRVNSCNSWRKKAWGREQGAGKNEKLISVNQRN